MRVAVISCWPVGAPALNDLLAFVRYGLSQLGLLGRARVSLRTAGEVQDLLATGADGVPNLLTQVGCVILTGPDDANPWEPLCGDVVDLLCLAISVGTPVFGDAFALNCFAYLASVGGRRIDVAGPIGEAKDSLSKAHKSVLDGGALYDEVSGEAFVFRDNMLRRVANIGLRRMGTMSAPSSMEGRGLVTHWMGKKDKLWVVEGVDPKECVIPFRSHPRWRIHLSLSSTTWRVAKEAKIVCRSNDGPEILCIGASLFFSFNLGPSTSWAKVLSRNFFHNLPEEATEVRRLRSAYQRLPATMRPSGFGSPASMGVEIDIDAFLKRVPSLVTSPVASPEKAKSPGSLPSISPVKRESSVSVRVIPTYKPYCSIDRFPVPNKNESKFLSGPYIDPGEYSRLEERENRSKWLAGHFSVLPCTANPPTKPVPNYVNLSPYDPPSEFGKKLRPTDKSGFVDPYHRGFVFNFSSADPAEAKMKQQQRYPHHSPERRSSRLPDAWPADMMLNL